MNDMIRRKGRRAGKEEGKEGDGGRQRRNEEDNVICSR